MAPLLVLLCLVPAFTVVAAGAVVVTTPTTIYRGTSCETSESFLKIPYARPPVGELRFLPPEPLSPPPPAVDASRGFGPACWQATTQSLGPRSHNVTVSEDCLHLNVFRPRPRPASPRRPLRVVVFVHGGAFVNGDASLYPGGTLAALEDIIVVTIQYRLNLFGFFALDPMDEPNLGLRDQQEALRWVQANIEHFGGDPGDVSLWGQSAGGMSTVLHLLLPSSAPLFRGVLADSPGPWRLETRGALEAYSNALAVARGCEQAESGERRRCLQELPADELYDPGFLNALPTVFNPAISDSSGELPAQPLKLLQDGAFNAGKTVLIGHNEFEGNLGAYSFTASLPEEDAVDEQAYRALSASTSAGTGARLRDILDAYEGVEEAEGGWVGYAKQGGDAFIACGAALGARAIQDAGISRGDVKSYLFAHHAANSELPSLNATHTSELGWLFGDLLSYWQIEVLTGGVASDEEEEMGEWMRGEWMGRGGGEWGGLSEGVMRIDGGKRGMVGEDDEAWKSVACTQLWESTLADNDDGTKE